MECVVSAAACVSSLGTHTLAIMIPMSTSPTMSVALLSEVYRD